MTRFTKLLLGVLASITPAGIATAQNPQPAPPQETRPPVAPPNSPTPPPERIAPPDKAPGATADQNLSDRLSRQQGTLRPPTVDPGIQAPAPRGQGAMPVIPPPGTPGGDQKVVPK